MPSRSAWRHLHSCSRCHHPPSRLHCSVAVEVIVLAADLGPAVGYHLTTGREIVPHRRSGSLIPCRIALRQFQPLVSRHDAGTRQSIRRPPSSSTRCCPGIEIAPEIVCAFLPGIRHLIAIVVHIYPAVSRLLPAFCRVRCQVAALSSALRKGRRLPVSVSSYTSPPSSRLITSILPPAAHSHTSRRVETASDAYNALFCSRYVQSIIYLIYILTGDVGIFKEIYLSIYLLFGRKPFKRFDTPINDRYN